LDTELLEGVCEFLLIALFTIHVLDSIFSVSSVLISHKREPWWLPRDPYVLDAAKLAESILDVALVDAITEVTDIKLWRRGEE